MRDGAPVMLRLVSMPGEMTFRGLQAHVAERGARLVIKGSWFDHLLHWLVVVFTFGGNRSFLDEYTTTIGKRIAVGRKWAARPIGVDELATIEHELVHVGQFERFGGGNAWAGVIPMAVVYLLVPFPWCIAWGRWTLERDAYLTGMLLLVAEGRNRKRLIDGAVEQMCSGRYGFTLAGFLGFRPYVRRWFDERLP